MESPETFNNLILKEKRLKARLQVASVRVEEAERERVWAIAATHSAGLSIRQIAVAYPLSVGFQSWDHRLSADFMHWQIKYFMSLF